MKEIFFIQFQVLGIGSVLTEFFSNTEKKEKERPIIEANGHFIIGEGSIPESFLSENLNNHIDCGYGVRVTPMGLKNK